MLMREELDVLRYTVEHHPNQNGWCMKKRTPPFRRDPMILSFDIVFDSLGWVDRLLKRWFLSMNKLWSEDGVPEVETEMRIPSGQPEA